ncbi:angiopoietin-related protein 7 isoform X2 [Drosophila grimshawi]|uniref:GH16419 n=1 Tax=Drosophila grimshawi TaxID=7222 RepID=B4IZV1_DROGR|nr:angiopoietin-related protein 7 isoform X2 [Drosophila grimshawi]EDV96723.1 GH16419 [Drosophila grimshawi]
MGTPSLRLFLALTCVIHMATALQETPTRDISLSPNRTQQPSRWRAHTRSNFRHTNGVSATPSLAATQHSEVKELINNLHDRVGILATLDEDQRHRLEVIDKKIDQLLDSITGRMESLRAQQLNFQHRLDSFEHIQRLSRNTLDELKDLSRRERAAEPQDVVAQNTAALFNVQSDQSNLSTTSNGSQTDVSSRLESLATFLYSLAHNVRETQGSVGRLVQNTDNIRRRLASLSSRPLPQQGGPGSSSAFQERATSCQQSYLAVKGILKLQLTEESEPFYVPCEDDGWTVIMNRSADDISFERSWLEYKEGFGNLAGDFFIGLDKLHALTTSSLHELRIWLQDFDGNVAIAGYDSFLISGEKELYALSLLGNFQSDLEHSAGDSLSYHAGSKFSTFDNDNDGCVECNCAQRHKGGGWFNSCGTSNLMGAYHKNSPETAGETGIYWDTFQGKDYSLRAVKMLIRPLAQDEAKR